MNNHGAAFYSEVPAGTLVAAFEAMTVLLGYARIEGSTGIEVRIWTTSEGACVRIRIAKSLALGVARKLAAGLGKPVRVFTASLVDDARPRDCQADAAPGYDCLVDDLTFQKDGTSSVGRWGTDMVAEHGTDWDEVCDGKSYYAVNSLLTMAVESVLPHAMQRTYVLHAPPSLGHARLDVIASQIRLADRVELAKMAGRECVRITTVGTTVTSFLEPGDAVALTAGGVLNTN
jgi:hypothetical protein